MAACTIVSCLTEAELLNHRVVGYALGLCFGSVPLAAQGRTGAISGVVKDDLGAPIASVEVSVQAAARVVRTDSAGKFVLASLPAGTVNVGFRRLAFAPVVLRVEVPANDTSDVEVTLTVVAEQLKGVIVQEDADHIRQLEDFERRRKLGFGHFITRSDIERRHPLLLSDMMRMIPGISLLPGPNGRVAMRFARADMGGRDCPPQFWIDGIPVVGFNVDDMPATDVEGIELYAGAATLPAQFNKLKSNAICGTVVVWTRVPGH